MILMKAIVKVQAGPRNIKFLDVEEPSISSEEVLIEVKAAGICGTDLLAYDWGEAMQAYGGRLPFIMGHEFSGMVVKAGEDVKDVHEGDKVTANPILDCGHCFFCRKGMTAICDNRLTLGLGIDGAFANFVAIPARNVYKLPENITYDAGALIEPFCACVHATERVQVGTGDTVVITGPGPMGLLTLYAARMAGASQVIVTGLTIDGERLKLAKDLGADVTIDVQKEDPVKIVKNLTGGLGADVVFEASGASKTIPQAIDIARKGAEVGLIGIPHGPSEVHGAIIVLGEKKVTGVRAYYPQTWRRAMSIVASGKVRLDRLITDRLPLNRAEEGFKLVRDRKALKTILIP